MRLRAILLSLGLATAAQAAPELTSFYTTPAGWQVFYHTATRNCGMVREHKMGTNVIVNYEREDDSWTFSLSNNNWHRVVHDQKYHVYLMRDGRERWEGDFTGSIWSGRRMLSLPRTKIEFIKEFMAYNTMTISIKSDDDSTTVYLDGSWEAILKVVDCQRYYQS